MAYPVYRFNANDALEHLGDGPVVGGNSLLRKEARWPNRGEVIWVGGDWTEWASDGKIVYVRDMVVS